MLTRAVITVTIIALFAAGPAVASASLDIEKEDQACRVLKRLEGEGIIRSGLLSARPIWRNEAQRLLIDIGCCTPITAVGS